MICIDVRSFIHLPLRTGTLQVGGDLADVSSIATVITDKMAELTGKVSADNLFSPSGANGQAFTDIWSEANLYFNEATGKRCRGDVDIYDIYVIYNIYCK